MEEKETEVERGENRGSNIRYIFKICVVYNRLNFSEVKNLSISANLQTCHPHQF